MNKYDLGNARDPRNGRDIPHEIEIDLIVERRADGRRCIDHQKRVAVRLRAHNALSANISTGAWLVLDDKLLAEQLRQVLSNEACKEVSRNSCCKRNDHAD